MNRTAKLFNNGGSQAVRLPAEYRFEGDFVYVRRDPLGNVILSRGPRPDWAEFIALRERLGHVPEADDFLAEREQPDEDRDPFDDWRE